MINLFYIQSVEVVSIISIASFIKHVEIFKNLVMYIYHI